MMTWLKVMKWIAIGLGISLAIILMVGMIFVWKTNSRLECRLAAIRAAGDPVTLADLARKPIDPERNAYTYLDQAAPGIEEICDLLYPESNDPTANKLSDALLAAVTGRKSKESLDLAVLETLTSTEDDPWEHAYGGWEIQDPRSSMPGELQKSLKQIYATHAETIQLIEQAAACPDYDAELDYTLPPSVFSGMAELGQESPDSHTLFSVTGLIRSATRVLAAQVDLYITEGKYDAAVDSAITILQLSRQCGRNPTSHSFLVTATIAGIGVDCANRALQAGPVSPETRDKLDAELARHDGMDGLLWAMKSERAYFLAASREELENHGQIGSLIWKWQVPDCLEAYDAVIPLAKTCASWKEVESKIGGLMPPESSALALRQLSACEVVYQVTFRIQALTHALRVLNALQAKEIDGEIPDLKEMGLPTAATIDPFSGESLHVKRLPEGYLIYSVGKNLLDDGGKIRNPLDGDVGIGPPPRPSQEKDQP